MTSGEFWLVSTPGEKTAQEAWDRLNRTTSDLSSNFKFNVPDLKLVGLSDDLSKLDSSAEQMSRKLVNYFAEVLENERDKLYENLIINGKDISLYVTKFQWDGAKYPVKQSLKVISEIIAKITQIDNDLKTKATAYNNLKSSLASLARKTTGSMVTKDLGEIVTAADFVLNSDYLTTLIVVVPNALSKEWESKYERLADMVVPRSSRRVFEDTEYTLFTVTLFKKVQDEYKSRCRELRFVVRDFVYDEESLKAGRNEKDKLSAEKQRQYGPLVRWLRVNFAEIYSAYVHIKALRVFVEYGLPVNFQSTLLVPKKGAQRRLAVELYRLYQHLDGSASVPIENIDDSPALLALGMEEYYPYIFFKVNVEFIDRC